MRPLIAFLFALTLLGCASNGRRIDAQAAAMGLARIDVVHAGLLTYAYVKPGAAGATLTAFLEGDGRPWLRGDISFDPATRHPVALELLARTPGPVAYIVRPCYLSTGDRGCTPDLWTSARYSEPVIASIAAAILEGMRRADANAVDLVGYSGGGALAILAAERMDRVAHVTTIGANLDIDAWTQHHGYLPLERSLNPARSSQLHPWPELHLQGDADANVPPVTTNAYFERYPGAQRRVIDGFDHVCCWVEAWPQWLREQKRE
jgi:hypothetical protein